MIRRVKSFEVFSRSIRENNEILFPQSINLILEGSSEVLNEKVQNFGPFQVDLENGPTNHGKRKLGNWESDNAWDLFAPAGTVVNSYTDGKVTRVKNTGKSSGKIFGTQVSIQGENGYPTIFYTHLKNVKLKSGDRVTVGQKIGEVSEWDGHDSSTHVHIGLPYGKKLGDLISGVPTEISTNSSTTSTQSSGSKVDDIRNMLNQASSNSGGILGGAGKVSALSLLMQTRIGKNIEGYLMDLQKDSKSTDSPTPHNELLDLLRKNKDLKNSQIKNADLVMSVKKDANAVIKPDSSLLPPSRDYVFKNQDKITWDSLKKSLVKEGFWKRMDPNEYNIVAIRNYLSEKKKSPNHFIDLIVLMSPETDKKVWSYRATTVPGPMFMVKPFRNWYLTTGSKDNINPDGLAIVQPGVYKYRIGSHDGYDAFNQDGDINLQRYQPVDSPEDANFKTFSPGKPQRGKFGINIHRASSGGDTSTVDTWSAGCMVFSNAADLKSVISRVKKSGQNSIDVALVQMDDIGKELS